MPQLPLTLWPGLTQQNVGTVGYRRRRTERPLQFAMYVHHKKQAIRSPLDGDTECISVALRAMGLTHGPCTTGIGRARVREKGAAAMGCAHGA